MKKIFYLCFSFLLLSGCGDNEEDGGRRVTYSLEEGDLKLTITKDYIIVDTIYWVNNVGDPMWKFKETISRSDSIACRKLLKKLLVK